MSVGLSFYNLEIKKILTYRVEFWIGFLGNIATQFGVAFFLWKAIFSARGVTSLQGYSFGALMLYYLLVPLVDRCVHGQEMGYVSGEIYDGGLSRFLIYPVSYFRIKYLAQLAQTSVYLIQLALCLLVFAILFHASFSPTLASLAKALPVILMASVLHFSMTVNLEMLAFWADNVWSISVLNRIVTNLLGGGLLPLVFFPKRAQEILQYLPFTRLVSFPIRCLLGQVATGEWIKGMVLTLLWAAFFAATAAWTWRRGLRGYTGVGI
jgi:ABC-2 type transport system permease protein